MGAGPPAVLNAYGPTEATVCATWTVVEPGAAAAHRRSDSPTPASTCSTGLQPVRWGCRASCTSPVPGLARGYWPPGADRGAVRARPVRRDRARASTGPATWRGASPTASWSSSAASTTRSRSAGSASSGRDRGGAEPASRRWSSAWWWRAPTPAGGRLVATSPRARRRAPGNRGPARFPRSRLPDYMMPAAFVVWAGCRSCPNGRLDRRASRAVGGGPRQRPRGAPTDDRSALGPDRGGGRLAHPAGALAAVQAPSFSAATPGG